MYCGYNQWLASSACLKQSFLLAMSSPQEGFSFFVYSRSTECLNNQIFKQTVITLMAFTDLKCDFWTAAFAFSKEIGILAPRECNINCTNCSSLENTSYIFCLPFFIPIIQPSCGLQVNHSNFYKHPHAYSLMSTEKVGRNACGFTFVRCHTQELVNSNKISQLLVMWALVQFNKKPR